jgi:hypothetical protein
MFPVRTSSSGGPSSPSVTSPTHPPSRNLPPIPGPEDGNDSDKNSSGAEKASDGEDRKSSEKSVEKSRSGLEELQKQAAELGQSEETGIQKTFRRGLDNISAVATVGAAGSAILSQGVAAAGKAIEDKSRSMAGDNSALSHLIQLADKLVDVGKVVPFIAPAFIILKVMKGSR